MTRKVWDEVLKWPWLSRLKRLRLHDAREVKAPDFYYTVAQLKDLPAYRKAFEKRVDQVDWDTEYVTPWDGNTCWHGLTWQDRPRRLLFGMDRFVRSQDYAGLETEYRELCRKLDGDDAARRIDKLPFARYEKALAGGFDKTLVAFDASGGQCIYLRLRPDVDWVRAQSTTVGKEEPSDGGGRCGEYAVLKGRARRVSRRSLSLGLEAVRRTFPVRGHEDERRGLSRAGEGQLPRSSHCH